MKIVFNKNINPYHGYLWGLRQPCIGLNIKIIDADSFNCKQINFYTAILLKKIGLPQQLEVSDVGDMVSLLALLMIEPQRNIRIPTYRDYKISVINQSTHEYKLYVPITRVSIFEISLKSSLTIMNRLLELSESNNDENFVSELDGFIRRTYMAFNKVYKTGQNYFSLVNACYKLKTPIQDFSQGKLRVGIGHKTQVYKSSINSNTSPIGIDISGNKAETTQQLLAAGMPAPINFKVKDKADLESLVKSMGFPLVVKPNDKDRGEGVYANISDLTTLNECYQKSLEASPNILLEKHISGNVYRFTLHNHQVVKLTKKDPLGITGDGVSTIRELSEILSHRLNKSNKTYQVREVVNDESLGLIRQFGFNMESVLELDYFLPLRRKNNSSAMGKTKVLKIQESHPENIELMSRVSRLFGLNIVGIDFIIPDIKESWLNCESIICDVNAKPQSDPITIRNILSKDLPNFGRIPSFLIIVPANQLEKTIDTLPSQAEKFSCNSYCSSHGIFINSKRVSKQFVDGFDAAKAMFLDQSVHRCLVLIDYDDILNHGLPLEFWSWIRLVRPENPSDNDLFKFNTVSEMIQKHTYNLEIKT
jgi:cyanophycin synthetase